MQTVRLMSMFDMSGITLCGILASRKMGNLVLLAGVLTQLNPT